jgi:hypothetical protein
MSAIGSNGHGFRIAHCSLTIKSDANGLADR